MPSGVFDSPSGDTLDKRLSSGPIPVPEALEICLQVARALEAAHGQGIFHHDLKPANIAITPEGKVKILEMGLSGASGGEVSLLESNPYLAPEQVESRPVDNRTDIWAFGCVLYEALTGKPAFTAGTPSETATAIVERDPDWERLPEGTPGPVRSLLQRCLSKDPDRRLHAIADARVEIEETLGGRKGIGAGVETGVRPAGPRGRWIGVALLAGTVLAGSAVGIVLWNWPFGEIGKKSATSRSVTRFSIEAPAGVGVYGIQISADGSSVIYGDLGTGKLYKHRLDRDLPEMVDSPAEVGRFGFSPDGRWLAFVGETAAGSERYKLFKVPFDGSSPAVQIADIPSEWNFGGGPFWHPDGWIGFVVHNPETSGQSLIRIPADGGPVKWVTDIHHKDGGIKFGLFLPSSVLPGGRYVLTNLVVGDGVNSVCHIGILDLETGEVRTVVEEGITPRWSPTGHLLFTRGDKLLAVRLDPDRLETVGGPVAVTTGLKNEKIGADYDVSPGGTLAYQPGGRKFAFSSLVIVHPDGRMEPWVEDRRFFVLQGQISRNGRMQSVGVVNDDTGLMEIWISEIDNPKLRPLAADPGKTCGGGIWTPGADSLVYYCSSGKGGGGVFLRGIEEDDEPQLLYQWKSELLKFSFADVSPDGKELWFYVNDKQGYRNYFLPMEADAGGDRTPRLIPELSGAIGGGFSHDGNWVAYTSEKTGESRAYIRRYLDDGTLGPEIIVSSGPGRWPWFRPTAEGGPYWLQYLGEGAQIMEVTITTDPEFRISEPREVDFDWAGMGLWGFEYHPDGRVFGIKMAESIRTNHINVVLNWTEELESKIASGQ